MTTEEIVKLVEDLKAHEDDMEGKDFDFFKGAAYKVDTYGERAIFSRDQARWLADLGERYLD